ncbi:hypothetical protein COCVIDRAFT_91657, partial [Bipolaris victoriae FI3]
TRRSPRPPTTTRPAPLYSTSLPLPPPPALSLFTHPNKILNTLFQNIIAASPRQIVTHTTLYHAQPTFLINTRENVRMGHTTPSSPPNLPKPRPMRKTSSTWAI